MMSIKKFSFQNAKVSHENKSRSELSELAALSCSIFILNGYHRETGESIILSTVKVVESAFGKGRDRKLCTKACRALFRDAITNGHVINDYDFTILHEKPSEG